MSDQSVRAIVRTVVNAAAACRSGGMTFRERDAILEVAIADLMALAAAGEFEAGLRIGGAIGGCYESPAVEAKPTAAEVTGEDAERAAYYEWANSRAPGDVGIHSARVGWMARAALATPSASPSEAPVAWTADQLWNNSALMALNAEMGLTMDQLVKLASALSKPAKLEPLTDERIMQFMAPWHIEDDAADRADIIKCVRAMLTHPSAGAGVPQEVAMPSENALLSCMQIPVDPEGHCPLTGDERSLYMATNVVYACAAAWGIRLKGEQQGYDSHQRYHDDNHG